MQRAYALLAGAQLAIGAAAIFARFGLAGGGPVAVSAWRLLIASMPLVALALARGAYRRIDARTERRLVLAGLALAAHFALWIASLQSVGVALSTLLVCTTPVWTECIATVRLRRIRPRMTVGVALGIAGTAIVAGAPQAGATPAGMALALGGAIAIAVYLELVGSIDARYTTTAVVARTYPIAALALIGAAAALHDRTPALNDLHSWGGIFAMALISQLFGHTALNAAVRSLGATVVAAATLLEPVIAALLAALVFGEHPSLGTLVGAIPILAAIAICLQPERQAVPAAIPGSG